MCQTKITKFVIALAKTTCISSLNIADLNSLIDEGQRYDNCAEAGASIGNAEGQLHRNRRGYLQF